MRTHPAWKTCSGECRTLKPLNDYWNLQRNPDGKDNVCSDCRIQAKREYEATPRGIYESKARLISTLTKPRWFPRYDPTEYQLDHKFSIRKGYQLQLSLDLISNRNNLQLITTRQNRIKGDKCSITRFELEDSYTTDPHHQRILEIVVPITDPEKLRTMAKMAADYYR